MFNLKLLNIFDEEELFESKMVSLSTDSRTYLGEEVFICLTGESFDAFDFIENVLSEKCEVVIFRNSEKNIIKMEQVSNNFPNITFLGVDSTLEALQSIATERIKEFKKSGGHVFAITGSNGKTTTKEMLTYLLKSAFGNEVHATKGNFNNHIGVPLTILSAGLDCNYMIIEMGANHMGEIQTLCEIAQPEFGLITSIGAAHIGLFGSIDNIFTEKKSLYEYILSHKSDRSKFVVNGDDLYLGKIPSSELLVKFGKDQEVSPIFNSDKIDLTYGITIENVNIQEKYNLNNLICAFLLSVNVFPEFKGKFIKAANDFTIPSLNRSEWISKNEKRIFLDAYNANPTSMESSLSSFIENISRSEISLDETLFVLGDMNELGDYAENEHKRIAEYLKNKNAKQVAFVGRYSCYYELGFDGANSYAEKIDLEKAWPDLIKKTKAIFIKASRSLQLESLIDIT